MGFSAAKCGDLVCSVLCVFDHFARYFLFDKCGDGYLSSNGFFIETLQREMFKIQGCKYVIEVEYARVCVSNHVVEGH